MKKQVRKQVINLSLFLALCLLPCAPLSAQWTQQGADIDGEADFDQSGRAVALSSDGTTVAIGSTFNAGGGTQRGHVRVYKRVSGTWTQQGADIDGEANNDQSGFSVSLSSDGTTVAIGSVFNAGGGTQRGHVRVYQLVSGTWTKQGADIDGKANGDQNGYSVSLSSDGTTVAIGAASVGGTARGYVRVYQLVSGTWTQQGADINGEANNDQSGTSVSLSSDGTTVAIGSIFNAGGGTQRGHVRVYKRVSGTWTQQGADIDGEAASDQSGYSVSLSSDGTTVAIGAINNAGGGSGRGHVRVYQLVSGTWTQQGADIDGEADSDQSGYSVSLSSDGTTVAIGAPLNAGGGSGRGHIRVYQTCTSFVTPSVSIAANPSGAITAGTSVTFTATPTHGGTTPQYQWQKGGANISGATSATYTSTTLANGDVITCVMTSNDPCVSTTTATSTGITMTVSAPIQNGLDFDGANDFVSINTGSSSLSGSFTVECWIKPTSFTNVSNPTLFSSRTPTEFGIDVQLTASGNLHADIGNGSGFITTSADATANLVTDTWYHIAFVVTPTGYTYYKDGVNIGSGSFSGTPLLFDATHTLVLGAIGPNPSGSSFQGLMDEFRIWNVARSEAQILSD